MAGKRLSERADQALDDFLEAIGDFEGARLFRDRDGNEILVDKTNLGSQGILTITLNCLTGD